MAFVACILKRRDASRSHAAVVAGLIDRFGQRVVFEGGACGRALREKTTVDGQEPDRFGRPSTELVNEIRVLKQVVVSGATRTCIEQMPCLSGCDRESRQQSKQRIPLAAFLHSIPTSCDSYAQ